MNNDNEDVFNDLDNFLEKQVIIYEDKKCITKKVRLECKNTIEELRKNKIKNNN
jgi:hypothetical protein